MMKKFLRVGGARLAVLTAVGLVACVGLLAAHGGRVLALPRVAICGTPVEASWNTDVQTKLQATDLFGAVDLIDCGSKTPSVSKLSAYAAVLVYSDNPFADATRLGDNLADYVDAGGHVAIATYGISSNVSQVGGRLLTDGYLPFIASGSADAAPTDGSSLTPVKKDDPESPLLTGVRAFSGGTSSKRSLVALAAGATQVAHWSDGTPFLAVMGHVVGLNFYPPSSDARADFWAASTDGARLIANALATTTTGGN
jgi:hypothetical protein